MQYLVQGLDPCLGSHCCKGEQGSLKNWFQFRNPDTDLDTVADHCKVDPGCLDLSLWLGADCLGTGV